MFNFRITSFIVLTNLFWMVELSVASIAWVALSFYFTTSPRPWPVVQKEDTSITKQEPAVKKEDDMSDTPHTFPTLSGQPPLQYSSPRVKEEEPEELPVEHRVGADEQADDEDDMEYVRDDIAGRGFTDSGIGTSMESSAGRPGAVRRRRSRVEGD